ncbi:MAG: DUF1566 domain-containing protein [Gammaproteobacteria bacterium]
MSKRLIFVILPCLAILAGCGGGGETSSSNAPSIQNLNYSPSGAFLNDGDGSITINGSIDFTDPDGNVSSYYLTIYDSNKNVVTSLSGAIPATGITSGTLLISLLVGTSKVENYSFAVYIKDTQDNSSNTLTGLFPVIGPTPVNSALPDTGANKCYNATSPINCPLTETEPYFGQDFQFASNPMSFTNNGDGTITDNVTNLMWQMTPVAINYNWYEASGTYDASANPTTMDICGSLNLGGYSDWRLPDKREILSIVDYGNANPAIYTSNFPDTSTYDYWTNTTYNTTDAWYVRFTDGGVTTVNKTSGKHVQCVRGAHWGGGIFVDNNDGTVTDTVSSLMWQQTAMADPYDWQAKLHACANLTLAGHTDWRLPDIKELATTADAGSVLSMSTDATLFSSSTTNVNANSSMWVMQLSPSNPSYINGEIIGDCCGGDSKSKILGYTRCVR